MVNKKRVTKEKIKKVKIVRFTIQNVLICNFKAGTIFLHIKSSNIDLP